MSELRMTHETASEAQSYLTAARSACRALIERQPREPRHRLRLAAIERRGGRYRASHAAVLSAAEAVQEYGSVDCLAEVVWRLVEFHELGRAQQLIHACDWHAPDVVRKSPLLSQVLWLAGDDAGALAFIGHVERYLAPNPGLAYSRAQALRHLGLRDAASEAYEQAIAIDPDYGPAHWSLAYHAPAGDARRLHRLRTAMARCGGTCPGCIDLHYALYRELEAAGHFEDAWVNLSAAAAMKRSLIGGMPARPSNGPALPLGSRLPEEAPARFVFIVGMPRSGTTVMERILGNHPDVAAAGELNDFHGALCSATDCFLPLPASGQSTTLGVVDLACAGERYRSSTAHLRRGRLVLVDKNPSNFAYVRQIVSALPEARIVCLVRDPMDACFSNLKEQFEGDAYPYSYDMAELADYYAEFDRERSELERHLQGRFLSVRYEDLVADPAACASTVLAFCGLRDQPGCDRIEHNTRRVATASSSQVREAIHRRYLGSWKPYSSQLVPLRQRLRQHGYDV